MMRSEITQEIDEEISWQIGAQRGRIRRILENQKSLYLSSSTSLSSSLSSSTSASCSSSSSCSKRRTLLELMKGGSTSLRRLFDMEHTSLATYFDNYSGSPVIKPILLWGSDTDIEQVYDPWASIKQMGRPYSHLDYEGSSNFASDGSLKNEDFGFKNRKGKMSKKPKLKRKKSFRRLPGFGFSRFRGFRFRIRLRKLRIMICGRKV